MGDDERFIFFTKENAGQGDARNYGLDRARGEYLSFLDSDEEYALILEYDVIGTDKSIEKVFVLSNKLPNNSLVICGKPVPEISRFRWAKTTFFNSDVSEISKFSYRYVYGAYSYVITRHAAVEILNFYEKYLVVADMWNVFFKNVKTKMYYVEIFSHSYDYEDSNLEFDRSPRKETFWGKIFSINILAKIYRRLYTEIYCKLLKLKGYKKL